MTRTHLDRRFSAGFTLLELLVTMSIMAILVTVGVPSFQTSIDNRRMTNATNDLVMALNLARSEAVKRGQYVTICKSTNGSACNNSASWNDGWIVFQNNGSTGLGAVSASEEVLRAFPALDENLSIDGTGNLSDRITFRPSGTVGTGTANRRGTLVICDERGDDAVRGIAVQSSGQWSVSYDSDHNGSALSC